MSTCVILGAGGHARETYWNVRQSHSQAFSRFVFVDEINSLSTLHIASEEWPIVRNWNFQQYENPQFLVGVGDPKLKVILVEKALSQGLKPAPTQVHQSALIQDPTCALGVGGVIAAGCILTSNVRLGDYVSLGTRTVVSHDSAIGDYVTCCPGVLIAGNVSVSTGVFLGIGSSVREKIKIAPSVIVGAQACVIRDIPQQGVTVVGVPAAALDRIS